MLRFLIIPQKKFYAHRLHYGVSLIPCTTLFNYFNFSNRIVYLSLFAPCIRYSRVNRILRKTRSYESSTCGVFFWCFCWFQKELILSCLILQPFSTTKAKIVKKTNVWHDKMGKSLFIHRHKDTIFDYLSVSISMAKSLEGSGCRLTSSGENPMRWVYSQIRRTPSWPTYFVSC